MPALAHWINSNVHAEAENVGADMTNTYTGRKMVLVLAQRINYNTCAEAEDIRTCAVD